MFGKNKDTSFEIAEGMEIALRSTASIFRCAIDAESVRQQVVNSVQTAIKNKGFLRQILAAAKSYPNISAIRLNFVVKGSAMGGKTTATNATVYDNFNNSVSNQTIAVIAKNIEDFLNQYDEIYPTKFSGDTVSYNNFAFDIDVKTAKDQNV